MEYGIRNGTRPSRLLGFRARREVLECGTERKRGSAFGVRRQRAARPAPPLWMSLQGSGCYPSHGQPKRRGGFAFPPHSIFQAQPEHGRLGCRVSYTRDAYGPVETWNPELPPDHGRLGRVPLGIPALPFQLPTSNSPIFTVFWCTPQALMRDSPLQLKVAENLEPCELGLRLLSRSPIPAWLWLRSILPARAADDEALLLFQQAAA
ncbi:MAG: hypothetical protein Kow00109_14460 [Acidobacteriota bacterium]